VSTSQIELQLPLARARRTAPLERHARTISVAALSVGLLLLVTAAVGMFADSWLALVAGREIAEHGLPTHDSLTALTLGRLWVDQQWLGQLGLFELQRVTREHLPIVVACLTSVPALLGALALGRRAASDRATAAAGLLALAPFAVEASQTRTQSLAYPLFVALLWLLLGRQTAWTRLGAISLVALWANVHGSVLLAAAAASLRWLQDVRSRPRRTVTLLGATWLATACSPYALELPGYYRSTALNSTFTHVLSEWRPLTLTPHALPAWLLIGALVWTLARSRRPVLAFEPALLLALVVLTLHSVRTIAFLALAAAALLPSYLGGTTERERPAGALARRAAAASLVVAAGLATIALTHAASPAYTPRAAAVATEVTGDGSVFAPLELGDWLLWLEPSLRGRVAMDARAELLTPAELERYAALWHEPAAWSTTTAGYRTLVLSPRFEPTLVRQLLALPTRFRVAYRDSNVVVFARIAHAPRATRAG
jgi:hypothetical protein